MEWSEWIENTGEEPDYPSDTVVRAKLRSGTKTYHLGRSIRSLRWRVVMSSDDVLMYKVPLHLLRTVSIPSVMLKRAKEIIEGEKDVSL